MFKTARLQLTGWYLLIIMMVSVLFSTAFYHATNNELNRIIKRVEFEQRNQLPEIQFERAPQGGGMGRMRPAPSIEDLKNVKQKSLVILIVINGCILILAGTAGFFLAGRTLEPIRQMINDQNEFISNASHELRTPIATLRAQLEGSLLEKNISDSEARAVITSNLEELETLQQLTNKFLRITQTSELAHTTQKRVISVSELLNSAVRKVAVLAKQKNIHIKTILSDAQILGDMAELQEVFIILLDNAIKYSKAKTTITITTKVEKKLVIIAINDQGIGIAKDELPHIFKRLYRADKSRSLVDGYGLGLSIARQIIESHSGKISVDSTIDVGTVFTLTLPKAENKI